MTIRRGIIDAFVALAFCASVAFAQPGSGPISGGGGGGGGDVVSAGDADGQTIQGQTGSNKARVIIDEGDYADSVRIVGPGADPAYISVQGTQLDLYPPGNNGAVTVTSSYFSFALGDGYWAQFSDGVVEFQVTGLRIVSTQTPPSSSAEACTSGDFIPSSDYIYFCVASVWKRVAISTW